MIAWSVSELGRIARGETLGDNVAFTSISTDTRTLQPGALFVALRGDNFDGHEYVAAAAKSGAAVALVDKRVAVDIPQVIVADVLAGLSLFAREWRRQFNIPVIGVTGSNGKTTTKELLGSILSQIGPCLITRGNLNNHIGVPVMLLEITASHRFAVIEMGANHQQEIAHLMGIAEPTIGIVTNAGAAHLEGFGSLDGVAKGKGEMFRALPSDGVAIINADDVYAPMWRDTRAPECVYTFGLEQQADFMAHKVQTAGNTGDFRIDFDLVTPVATRAAMIGLAGLHNLRNALGAAAASFAAGASIDHIVAGLAAMRKVAGRLEFKPAIHGAFLVDDSYNANPSSLQAGLDAFRSFSGERWLVLGEMRELGASADELHAQVGRYAKQTGVSRMLAVGEHARHAVAAFGANAQWFADTDALTAAAKTDLRPGVAVLIKGSRANRLERVAAALAASAPTSQGH